MVTASTPASSDDPPLQCSGECVDVECLLNTAQLLSSGEKLIRLEDGFEGSQVTLCPRAEPVIGARFKVRQSNVRLDCGGVVFDGSPFRRDQNGVAVLDESGTSVTRALDFVQVDVPPAIEDVVIQNCVFENFPQGISAANASIAENGLDLGLKNITFKNVVLENIDGGAIRIGADNRDNLIEGVTVTNARLYAVYLEAYSSHTRIRNSYFADNGWQRPGDA